MIGQHPDRFFYLSADLLRSFSPDYHDWLYLVSVCFDQSIVRADENATGLSDEVIRHIVSKCNHLKNSLVKNTLLSG